MKRTKRSGMFRRWTVVATVIALQAFVNPWIGAADPSSLLGVVVSSDAGGPIEGVRLHAGERSSGKSFTSEITGPDGTFRLGTLPSGSYDLAVEAGGGLYLVQTPVSLAPGEARSVEVRFDPKKKKSPNDPEGDGFRKPTALDNPGTATLIVLGFAFVAGGVDELFDGDDDEDDASPSGG